MRRAIVALALALLASAGASVAAAQAPSGGYYSGGYYYATDTPPDAYWPTNNETAKPFTGPVPKL